MPQLPSRISLLVAFSALYAHAALPQVDFDRMGKVGLAGAFAGFDFFSNSSVAFDPATSTLFSRSSDGSLTRLASTNSGGRINAACDLNGIAYFAGSFSSLADTSASNIVSYNPSSNSFSSLTSNSPNGEIRSIFCDQQDNKVWVGGSFTSPGSAVAVWDSNAQSWSPPPFKGFSGAQSRVNSITTNSSSSSIFFAGSFVTAFGTGSLNTTNNPSVPFSAGATPFSSSLVPIPLGSAEVEGSPSTADSGFTNIQNILCPAGPDGPGNSWFAVDNGVPLITVRAFSFISANGVRLGNTFQPDHGTTSFSITTIPDNQVRTLSYIDPATGQNQTCTDPCPLSTDSSLLYQDFLFDSIVPITGVQIKLSGFTGRSPGLHILQLLSSGAFASSVKDDNAKSCFAPSSSNITRTGDWVAKVANTDIAGTTQTVLVSDVDVGTSPASGPSFTWIPYVSAAGNYDVSLLIPGCNNLQDCDSRTSVQVTIFPGDGLPPSVSTISQRNNGDATVPLYSGPIVPSGPDFVTTITMTLADQPEGSGQNGKYEIVADRVQLVLKSVNFSTSSNSTNSPLQGMQRGFGFFEWPRSAGSNAPDASQILPNSSLTTLDGISTQMNAAISLGNPSALNGANITAVAHHPSGIIFLGGTFRLSSGTASGASNIVMFRNGALVSIADNGLNGPVSTLLIDQNRLYVGGAFLDTAAGTTNGRLRGIAVYEIDQNTWTALGSGVNGRVTGLSSTNGRVQVVGSFSSAGDNDASGIAAWNTASNTWTTSGGFISGDMSFIVNGTSQQWLAGNIVSYRKFGASGIAMLENGDQNGPKVNPVQVALSAGGPVASTVASSSRRSYVPRSTWITHSFHHLLKRQSPAQPNATLPLLPPAPAPAVLSGAFWTNGTSSTEITILGGNFTHISDSGATVSGVLLYDPKTEASSGLSGTQINGTVRALLVDGNRLYVGGEFTISGTSANGLASYDLVNGQWDLTNLQPLQASSGSPVVVRSITKSTSQASKVIVAGTFAQAGSLRCEAVCVYDTTSNQWNAPGAGISGQVATATYAGNNQEYLIVGGSLTVGGSAASVAQFDLVNSTWTALGSSSSVPGPVTAIEVNGGNASSIFAAGRGSDGSNTFLTFWNGASWSILGTDLNASTAVSQLTMVPLQDTHAAQGVIESDRMLMISGSLADSSNGNASSVLFDGQTFIPYIVSTAASGQPGFIASLFHSFAKFSFVQRKFLATGVVILISIAIAAGVVFLLALIGILWTLFSRRDDKLKYDAAEEEDDDSTHHRPSSLLEHINAATRTTILGTSPFSNYNVDKEEEKSSRDGDQDPFGPDASNYLRAETPSDAFGGLLPEESSRIAHVRYDFVPGGDGELPLQAGVEIEILDDKDPA
ncbi:hypothetical protein P691DRAFT_787446 [Macrolepiota fuliginosa MF-IS2]|uniref:SH3 domain-containing protein n=1 Tax=Macrolepiota fuliginosa MF-IS2 TaxID=1400762 RepID=A0A9P5XKJ5_9AGAR|nr:hypothetical protein P691DRAFT_787446 [Macrolepiota fuliginosa MF-IS2]